MFVVAMSFFSCNAVKCVSMNSQECKLRPEKINTNSNELLVYAHSVKISKCSASCSNINDPQAKLCAPDVVNNINIKVFNLRPRTNETRYIEWYETCKWKYRLDGSVCNKEQRYNEDKCRRECKELIDKIICDERFIWNPTNCECQCDRSCDVGEYFDYKYNCKCRKRLVDKLVEECNENVNEKKLHSSKIIYNSTLNDYDKTCSSYERSSCTICIVFFVIFFIISISISIVFIYFYWCLKRKYIEKTTYWMQLCWTYKWEILSIFILKIYILLFLMTWSILKTLIQT